MWLAIAVLLSVVIYLSAEKAKRPPPVSTVMVEKNCPECPLLTCLTHALFSGAPGSTTSLVSPGVMYYLKVGNDSIALKGNGEIWRIDAPGAKEMSLNMRGQLIVTNDKGGVVYETPLQLEGTGRFVAYISNQAKLEIMNMNTREVVFSK